MDLDIVRKKEEIRYKTYNIICHLLTQHEIEFGHAGGPVFITRLEVNKDSVLEEVVELWNARVQ